MAKYYSETSPAWAGVQVGTISMMPKDDAGNYYAPDGWMECNGRTINPNEYLALYQIIGTTYGGTTSGSFPSITGDFKIPDLRDRRVIGSGRLRPDGASPAIEGNGIDEGSINNCGSFGGKNNITLFDIATRVQVVQGSVQSTFNTSRLQQSSTQFTDGTLQVNSGFLANHTMPHWPNHSHGNEFWSATPGGGFTADRTSPGSGNTQIQGGANAGPNTHDGSQMPAVGQPTAPYPHSHWIGFKDGIEATFSYHRGWGDSIGDRGQNSHLGGQSNSSVTGYNTWYDEFCINADEANEGRISIDNGSSTIKPTASMMQWNVQYSPVDGTQITYDLDVDLGLDGNPDLQPDYQETSYMIYAGVMSSAYTPPPPNPAGDTVPDQVGPFNVGVSTVSGNAVVSFQITGVSSNYTFDVEVIKSGGESVGGTPINLQGTGGAVNTGYVDQDTVSMTLEAPSSGGTTANYEIRVKYNTVTQMTAVANITYEAAPTVTLSALPTTVTSGSAVNLTYDSPGATSVVASNFGATTPTGATVTVNPTVTTTYTITLGNAWGDTTATTVVTIAAANAPQINMTIFPTSMNDGSTATISYSCTNADTFVSVGSTPVDTNWQSSATTAASATYYSQTVSPSADTTYTVTLQNANGTSTASASITVVPIPAPTVTLSTDVTVIEQGNVDPNDDSEAVLTWSSSNADTITGSSTPAYGQWNPTTDSGTLPVGPDEDTTFTITATNASGSDSASVNIQVYYLPEITLTVTRGYTPSGGTQSISYVSNASTGALPWIMLCCEELVTVGWNITGQADTVTGGVYYGNYADDGTNPTNDGVNSNLGSVSGNASSGTWSSIKIAPSENGSAAGGSNAVSANKRQGMILIQASNTMGQTAAAAIRFKILTFRVARYSDFQDIAYFNKSGSSSNVTATFDASGNLVTGGSGSATVTFSFSWNDNPGDHGTALGTYEITSLGISFTQGGGTTGSLPTQTVTVVGGQTYNCTITNGNAAGFDRADGNQTLCFKDSDGSDCNATLSIVGGVSQQGETMQFGPISVNESYVDTSPALSEAAGSTWNCSSIICHIGTTTGELFAKVTNGKLLVEDLTGANSDNDYVDLTVHCNVADFTGASANNNTAATGNFAIVLPAGSFASSDINTLWEPGDGSP